MAKLVDALDLGSSVLRRESSSLSFRTTYVRTPRKWSAGGLVSVSCKELEMRVGVETVSGLERRLTVGLPADLVDQAVDQRLNEASKTIRLPGFRPGKVPLKIMRQKFGSDVRKEVLTETINRSYQKAIESEKLRPAGQPVIEAKSVEAGKDVEFTATFEVYPTVTINEVSGLKLTSIISEITDADVEEIIAVFQKQQGSLLEVSRPAELKDTVLIDFEGTRDGEPFEGGTASDQELELGSGRMIPGFEDGLVGMSSGDTKTLDLIFPSDYQAEQLRNAKVKFSIKLRSVKTLEPAPIDAKLFANYGLEGGDENAFRIEVRKNMERELHSATEAHLKKQVMDEILKAHPELEIPDSLVKYEIDVLRRQMFQQFAGAKQPDANLSSLLPDGMFSERAVRRVKLGLLISELIQKLGLKADSRKVRAMIEDIASTYQNPTEVINWYYEDTDQLLGIESRVLEDGVVEQLLENAEITDRKIPYQEALQLSREAQM